ncbi:hypothetical protein [Sphingomonas elodea]|uniref:hypothetical protein n=1 Tax=Sphingomonas elodea TaxID=179878 RepID=UPI0005911F2F|nr:hypothetical protein [Sphingomonas elodea]
MATSAAQAQCSPDPTVANTTTTCTGNDPDGIIVSTNGSTVVVANGAATGRIRVDIPVVPNSYDRRSATISVLGTVDGGVQSGITVLPGTVPANSYDYTGTAATVTIAAGAQVTGRYGVAAEASRNGSTPALASITNAGTISGTSGIALFAIQPSSAGFLSITNAATGTIGAISGPVGSITNAGMIDGGTRSAIQETSSYNIGLGFGTWTNSGTIRSNGAAATIAGLSQLQTVVNSGTIANSGSGPALQGEHITLTNQAGGRISTGGRVAVAAGTELTLVNAGTIVGDVGSNQGYGTYFSSSIDSTAGQIVGNVSFGSGNDVIYARYDGTATLVTGITGAIDGGSGVNSMVLAPTADLRLTSAVTLPTNFQRLRLAPGDGATLTLGNGFVAPSVLEITGAGTIVNDTAIAVNDQAFVQSYTLGGGKLVNKGTIQATVPTFYYALDLNNTSLTNSGRIESSGNGINTSSTVNNSGTIIARDTAVRMFGEGFTNSGTIRSTGGVGVVLDGNTYYAGTNSGRIEGATYGVDIGYVLNNSGTIAATGTGTAVGLDYYGVLNNLAGGVINGGAYAITGKSPYGTTDTSSAAVFNAGTINGNVSFAPVSGPLPYSATNNLYVALPGGVLNGNLTLSNGDTLVTDLVNTGPGSFAGITGTVTGTNALLRYRVSGQQSATIGAVGPFATTGYELVDGARLQLTAGATQTRTLVLAGKGTVELNATVSTTNATTVNIVAAAAIPALQTGAATPGLTLVNRGTLTSNRTDYWGGGYGVVSMGGRNTLDNQGTIRALYTATNGGDSYNAAVVGGDALINNGRIELDGSYGTSGVGTVTNNGTIIQTGTRESNGIVNAFRVVNNGTIQTSGPAITSFYGGVVVNTGTITSSGGRFGQGAIRLDGGRINNAGVIQGDVSLGYNGIYFANGGTLAGNLALGSGGTLLQAGDSTGVSGRITVSDGTFGRALTTSGSVAIGAAPTSGFTAAAVAAIGSTTTVTLTGLDSRYADLRVMGDGAVISRATIAGSVSLIRSTLFAEGDAVPLAGFTNAGTIGGSVYGMTAAMTNNGTIGGAGLTGPAVSVYNYAPLSFTNTGRIAAGEANSGMAVLGAYDMLTAANSGTIEGGLYATASFTALDAAGAATITNSGTLRATAGTGTARALTADIGAGTATVGTVSLANSGTIVADGLRAVGVDLRLTAGDRPITYALQNSGSIAASGSATAPEVAARGVRIASPRGATSGTLTNQAGGTISATGTNAVALLATDTTLTITNAGRITATGPGAAAIVASGKDAFTLTNTGTITGATLLDAGTDLVDNAGAMGALSLGAGDDRVVLRDGATNPRIDGGAGTDRLEIAGTATGAGIALGDVVNMETLRMNGGFATLAGTATFADVQLAGGRFVGLAGSTITAPTITVAAGATFGSAGTVNGNVAVAGTLSPGASPGTMTVNGNVALAGTSTALFELTPTASDRLAVNGQVSIASGATLQIVQTGNVTPGTVLDLITATGGISGSFTQVVTSGTSFGLFSQESGRIRVVSTYVAPAAFDGAARRGLDYVNAVLVGGRVSPALLAAAPQLLTASGTSSAAAFARLTPQAYAATRQISVENGLTLADAARGQAFAPVRDTPGLFSFAAALGGTRSLAGDPTRGIARTTTNGYGFLGGIGIAGPHWSLGAFGGYLNSRQTLADTGAHTSADGVVAGVHGRVRHGGIGLKATIAYDGAKADTRRLLPVGSASARYDLSGWTADASLDTQVKLAGNWQLRPSIGATAIRTLRKTAVEQSDSPFALTVAKRRGTAVFVDGGITFARAAEGGTGPAFRPYLTLGARYQVRGRVPYAVAGFTGNDIGLLGEGAARARALATAKLGADVVLSPRLVLFGVVSGEGGNADARAAARGGVRLAF